MTYNLAVVDDPTAIHDALAVSDNLLGLAGPLRGQVEQVLAAVHALFAAPGVPLGPQLVILEPQVDAPVALVAALDESGEPIYVRGERWPLSAPAEARPQAALPQAPTLGQVAELSVRQGPAPWLRSLPPGTAIEFRAGHTKTGKSGERFARCKLATTVGQL